MCMCLTGPCHTSSFLFCFVWLGFGFLLNFVLLCGGMGGCKDERRFWARGDNGGTGMHGANPQRINKS